MSVADKFVGIMSRRTFLIRCVQLPTFIASRKLWSVTAIKPIQPSVQAAGYGTGLYGQSSYPGDQVNLPLIEKE